MCQGTETGLISSKDPEITRPVVGTEQIFGHNSQFICKQTKHGVILRKCPEHVNGSFS